MRRRGAAPAFWLGCGLVTAGALLHLPMFLMGRGRGYALAGMPMDAGMLWGMALIVLGVGSTAYGLLPVGRAPATSVTAKPSEDAPLNRAHLLLMAVLVAALVVDVMKPASLGFVLPGMRTEYGLSTAKAAWLPFSALTGTFVGSIAWGTLADVYGRRASILLSTILFVGTSVCGAMPAFAWNVAMCFLMGAAAGGLLPVVYALLAETMPTRHRGWALVLVGGLGAAGGYLAASASSAVLQPLFGWRVMWFLNIPTGLLLVLLSGLIPESPRFMIRIGRLDAARRVLARFGAVLIPAGRHEPAPTARMASAMGAGLTAAGFAWGLVTFGVLLWLPAELVATGHSIAATSQLLAQSALLALPASLASAFFYARWSSKWTLLAGMAVTAASLIALALAGAGSAPILLAAAILVGSNSLLAALLPYAAELFPAAVRGRATGWVSGSTKFGGIVAQGFGLLGFVPAIAPAAGLVALLLAAAGVFVWRFGAETRGRALEDLERGRPLATSAIATG